MDNIMKSHERRPVIKLFMGKGDFADQLPLALKRERQGWIMAESPDDPRYKREKRSLVEPL